MAENKNKVRHVLHRRSNVSTPKEINIERTTLQVNEPKAPQSTAIEYGEIAVNYGDGNEALFIRNSSDEIVQLNSIKNIRYDGSIDSSLNQYLDERYVNRSGDTIYGDITITAQEGYGDDPKFKYNGSKFEVISDNLNMNINETSIDSQNMVLTVKGSSNENCDGSFEFNADNVGIDISCDKGEIISGNSELTINGTLTESVTNNVIQNYNKNYTLNVGANNNCSDVLSVNAQKVNIEGNCDIDVHSNTKVNISGNNEVNVNSEKINVDASNEVIINGDNKVQVISNLVDIDGSETTMDGDNLHVHYKNINLSGDTKVYIKTPLLDVDAIETTIDGNKISINVNEYNLSGTVTNMEGTTLNVDYDNLNKTITNEVENITNLSTTAITNNTEGDTWTIDYDNLTINGGTTTMNGDILNENYTTINRVTTTINNTATTENNYVDTTNFYGNVNIQNDFHVSGDSIFEGDVNISGDTKIWGDLILNPNKSFDGKLKYPLNFKIATSATKTNNATLIASVNGLKYNNSNTEGYTTEIGSETDPLVTKCYVDDVFENILDDKKITTAIDSFKELQEVLGVTNNGDVTSTTYNTVVNGINAKVNRSGDTMTGTLKIGSDGVTITTSGTINTKSNITSNGSISATNNISTESKFVGNLNNTLSFTSGKFSAKSFNNNTNVSVNVPTDISHLSCDAEPSSWTVFDKRYVNVSGDTMSGNLTVGTSTTKVTISTNGTIDATSSIYSSDKKLKKNIKSVSNKDIEAVSKIDLKSYKFINDETERERYGVIAQDLEKVGLNNLVVETDNKKGVDYISFLILKIAQLEKRIEELEKR